ncbi:exo-alpha-sialidase [Pseudarthrobacter sulfonivorans]|uniref:exo-alpha-sialidase n=1 Tax=Pseudarthrobacter sulfonivorans TaxID=121292 RepID=A0A0U3PAG0_9MICC|nr:sialidase family protein [Pseudarthrobacter sulfonivorans]ALV41299.1 exo-alpha-sialidase [Pseudarthrobacter sulfonivorans]
MTSYVLQSMRAALPDAEHVLAVRGTGGYRQYRIPALAVSRQGTLLAAYDGRPNLDDLPNPIDLLLRRSTDNGRTWGEQQVVRTGGGLNGYGDPSLLVDVETGRIFMFHAAGTRAGFFEAAAGLEPDNDVQHCDLSYSDDDGLTWQHRRITAQLKIRQPVHTRGLSTGEPAITGIFAAAGQGIQIHTGPYRSRLVQQFVVLAGGEIMAASAYSDDHGDTWTLGEPIGARTHGHAPNENKVASLQDGRLLMHSRGTPRRLAAISDDGGATWSALRPVEDLPDPGDNGSLVRFDGLPSLASPADDATGSWLLATNNLDTALRRNTVISLSTDDGLSWPAKLVLCPGSSAYSTAARLPDGNIGVLYERQGYREIVFASVPAEQLTAQLTARPAAAADPSASPQSDADARVPDGGAGLVFDMDLRSITPGRPKVWQNAGEFHVMQSAGEDWGVHTWKEIGQGYSAEAAQVIGTREAQDLNYGPIIPGYKVGDILAFTGRARNDGPSPVTAVRLSGPGSNAFPAADLGPGQEALYFTPGYTVTEADVAQGRADVVFEVVGERGGTAERRRRAFTFDTVSGDISEPK